MATHQETRAALVKSIEKWKKNEVVKKVNNAQIFGDTCPLCDLFFKPEGEEKTECEHCPVHLMSGRRHCEGTPWETAYYAVEEGDLRGFRTAAAEETKFLERVLAEMDKRT